MRWAAFVAILAIVAAVSVPAAHVHDEAAPHSDCVACVKTHAPAILATATVLAPLTDFTRRAPLASEADEAHEHHERAASRGPPRG